MRQRIVALGVVVGAVLLATSTFSAGSFDREEDAARRGRVPGRADAVERQRLPDAFLVVYGLRKESVLFFTMSEAAADGEAIPLDIGFTGISPKGASGWCSHPSPGSA